MALPYEEGQFLGRVPSVGVEAFRSRKLIDPSLRVCQRLDL